MKTKHPQTGIWSGVFGLVVLLVSLLPYPASADVHTTGYDVGRIDAFAREQVQRHGIPGLALAVVEGDRIVHMAGYGRAGQAGRSVTPQTPFVLASASKPLTALAVMQLVEAGMVELDAPVQRYLPEFRLADPLAARQVTLRHLLQHTSGLPERSCDSSRFGAETLEQFVAALQTIELDAPPGARHAYCSANYNLLGRIVEVVSSQPYAGYIEQHVFAPLQMRHSFASGEAAAQAGVAQGYWWLLGVPAPMEYPYNNAQAPAGFLIASAEDMAHLLIAQLNGGRYGDARILSPEGIAAMQAPGVPVGNGRDSYGLGWRIGPVGGVPAVFHPGDHPNTHTFVFFGPETRRGAVLLFNSQSMLAQVTAYQELQEGVAQLLAGREPAPATLSLPALYLIVDAVLGSLLLLALWPLLRLREWGLRLGQQRASRWWRLRAGLRLAWEFGVPLALLAGARGLLHALGAQSWREGLLLFPDIGAWLWTIALLVLLTGAGRVILLRRAHQVGDGA